MKYWHAGTWVFNGTWCSYQICELVKIIEKHPGYNDIKKYSNSNNEQLGIVNEYVITEKCPGMWLYHVVNAIDKKNNKVFFVMNVYNLN